MKCEVIHDLLPSYLDETCSEETKRLVDEHLNDCEDCQSLIKELKDVEDSNEQPIVLEDKVFKKVIKNHKKSLLIMLVIFILIFLLCGTRMNSEIIKVVLQSYAKNHYPEYDLVMTDFGYDAPSSQGVGIDNGFYYAEFITEDHETSDIQFDVFTEGYFFNIKDNYHAKIEMKDNTRVRLVNEYESEIIV